MTDRNANRPGYKPTPVGWIPEEWGHETVGGLVGELESGTSLDGEERPRRPAEKAVLKVSAVGDGRIRPEECKVLPIASLDRMRPVYPRRGEVIISRANAPELVGACAYVDRDWPELLLPDKLWQTMVAGSVALSTKWLVYVLQSHRVRVAVQSMATGTSKSMKNVSQQAFLGIRVPVPPLSAQQRTAEILSTWDEVLDQTRQLLAAARDRKRGLMQQLLTGKRRLPGFASSRWRTRRLGELFTEREETGRPDLPLLAITANGILPAAELDRKDASSADKSLYRRICPGDIGYNTMRMWQGVSAVSSLEGIVSPAYTVCIPNADVDVRFMAYLLKLPALVHQLWRHSQGLVDDTLNLKYHHFAQVSVSVPCLSEQRAIAAVLAEADTAVRLLEDKLAALADQKRGLMQKLLTGEVRTRRG